MKKLRVFIAAARSVPPTASGAAGRGFDLRVVGRGRREDPVEAEVEAEDAGGVGDGVAAAEPVGQRERIAVRVAEDRRVLEPPRLSSSVIRRRALARVRAFAAAPGSSIGGAGERPVLAVERQGQDDLAELVVVEVLRDHERLREVDQHALVALREGRVGERHRDVGRGDRAGVAVDDVAGRDRRGVVVGAGERRLVEPLAGERR